MAKRKRNKKPVEALAMTPERAQKSDVVKRGQGKLQIKGYGARLHARGVIDQRQLDTWARIEYLAEMAEYQGRPKISQIGGVGGGGEELPETERYIWARKKLSGLFGVLGVMGSSIIEFIVIMGEDAETYARRVPGWNRHKITGGLAISLDISANELGVGYRELN